MGLAGGDHHVLVRHGEAAPRDEGGGRGDVETHEMAAMKYQFQAPRRYPVLHYHRRWPSRCRVRDSVSATSPATGGRELGGPGMWRQYCLSTVVRYHQRCDACCRSKVGV